MTSTYEPNFSLPASLQLLKVTLSSRQSWRLRRSREVRIASRLSICFSEMKRSTFCQSAKRCSVRSITLRCVYHDPYQLWLWASSCLLKQFSRETSRGSGQGVHEQGQAVPERKRGIVLSVSGLDLTMIQRLKLYLSRQLSSRGFRICL